MKRARARLHSEDISGGKGDKMQEGRPTNGSFALEVSIILPHHTW
jgi:hypothetical protein